LPVVDSMLLIDLILEEEKERIRYIVNRLAQ
jgi:hypothetical protein